MFKVLILQASHILIKDRLSFMRFLGLGLADPVPDANTIWTFREKIARLLQGSRQTSSTFWQRRSRTPFRTGRRLSSQSLSSKHRRVRSFRFDFAARPLLRRGSRADFGIRFSP